METERSQSQMRNTTSRKFSLAYKKVMATGSNAGKRSRTLLDFHFLEKKRIVKDKDEVGHDNDQGKS